MEVKFVIWARTVYGTEFECFRWTRDEASGIIRAYADAKLFNIDLAHVWAVPAEG